MRVNSKYLHSKLELTMEFCPFWEFSDFYLEGGQLSPLNPLEGISRGQVANRFSTGGGVSPNFSSGGLDPLDPLLDTYALCLYFI